MPLHDWTRVEAGTFHGFHQRWLTHLCDHLNGGVLPAGYYAEVEQVTRPIIPDLVALHEPTSRSDPGPPGGIALADAPPRTRRQLKVRLAAPPLPRRHLAIRQVRGDHVVALIEVVSPANKDRPESVADFAAKVALALRGGVHVVVVDVFPPGPHDPFGMPGAIAEADDGEPVGPPADQPLTFASYAAGDDVTAYLDFRRVGEEPPVVPLFLSPGRYVNVPLSPSYDRTWAGTPDRWKRVIAPPG
jgi:hypothetical protein